VGFVFLGLICSGIFLFFIPHYVYYKDWKDTEYMVTNQRVFFETLSGYAVVNLEDVRDVYLKRGLHDRIYWTGRLFVGFRDFQSTTRFWKPGGYVIVHHKHLSFRFIKEVYEVQKIVQDAAEPATRGAVGHEGT
jgi:hypothetical protein